MGLFLHRIHIAVGCDQLLVVVEAVLAVALVGAVAFIVQIDIDKAVALGHLAGGLRNQVDHRYLQGLKFDAVCREVDRSRATITKLHAAALDALVVPEDSGTDTPES